MRSLRLSNERKGEIQLLLSSVVFAVVTLFVKYASHNASGLFIATWRFMIGVIVIMAYVKLFRVGFKVENKIEWMMRGFFGATAMVTFYLSIQLSTISRASLLCNTSPVFVAMFGFIFFREKIRAADIVSLAICFTGIIFIFYDRQQYGLRGDILGLLSGALSGVAIHYVKKSSMVNHPLLVYFSPCLFGLLCVPFTFSEYRNITGNGFLLIILVGVLTLIAQFYMTRGYKLVNPTKGSVLNYLQIPLTIMIGVVLMHDSFPFKMIIGTVLIFAGLAVNIIKFPNRKKNQPDRGDNAGDLILTKAASPLCPLSEYVEGKEKKEMSN
jgi:drug/metabolite transporter (DMT)-like permease